MIVDLLPRLHGHIPDHVYTQLPGVLHFGIDGPKRLSNFLGQCHLESGGFHDVYERLNYSAQGLANTWPKRYSIDPHATVKMPNDLARRLHRDQVAIANNCYANRMGNRDEASGDGWYRRGVGYIQTTGTDNQRAFFVSIGLPADSDPALIATDYPLASAAYFFRSNNLWTICDHGVDPATVSVLTTRINGGQIGLAQRLQHTQDYYRLLTA